jgi:hypothetical protein
MNLALVVTSLPRTLPPMKVNRQGDEFKVKYGRRARIWALQHYLLNKNYTIEAANARIIDTYGSDRITTIVKRIQADQQRHADVPFVEGLGFRVREQIANTYGPGTDPEHVMNYAEADRINV